MARQIESLEDLVVKVFAPVTAGYSTFTKSPVTGSYVFAVTRPRGSSIVTQVVAPSPIVPM